MTDQVETVQERVVQAPADVWAEMVEGNARFVAGTPQHPRQDVERRAALAHVQRPVAALFGCSDSRLAAEIIFDKGLGDLFVVRNAGQIISDSVLGSLEYAVAVLGVPPSRAPRPTRRRCRRTSRTSSPPSRRPCAASRARTSCPPRWTRARSAASTCAAP
jgi:hypothetical protein